jgi:hypothetical protein
VESETDGQPPRAECRGSATAPGLAGRAAQTATEMMKMENNKKTPWVLALVASVLYGALCTVEQMLKIVVWVPNGLKKRTTEWRDALTLKTLYWRDFDRWMDTCEGCGGQKTPEWPGYGPDGPENGNCEEELPECLLIHADNGCLCEMQAEMQAELAYARDHPTQTADEETIRSFFAEERVQQVWLARSREEMTCSCEMEAAAQAAEEESWDREERRVNQMGRHGLTNGDADNGNVMTRYGS